VKAELVIGGYVLFGIIAAFAFAWHQDLTEFEDAPFLIVPLVLWPLFLLVGVLFYVSVVITWPIRTLVDRLKY
jgi:fructose-specific phosphotransferase system IIC component